MEELIAFACNAKRFTIAIFSFLILSAVFGRTTKSFLANVVRSVTLEACDEDLTHFLDTPKNICVKVVPEIVIRDVCGTWQGLFTVTSIRSFQKKQKEQPEFRKKLGG